MSYWERLTHDEVSLIREIVACGVREGRGRPSMVAEVINLGFDRTTAVGLVARFDDEERSRREARARKARDRREAEERADKDFKWGGGVAALGVVLAAIGSLMGSNGTLVLGGIIFVVGGLFAIRLLRWPKWRKRVR